MSILAVIFVGWLLVYYIGPNTFLALPGQICAAYKLYKTKPLFWVATAVCLALLLASGRQAAWDAYKRTVYLNSHVSVLEASFDKIDFNKNNRLTERECYWFSLMASNATAQERTAAEALKWLIQQNEIGVVERVVEDTTYPPVTIPDDGKTTTGFARRVVYRNHLRTLLDLK